MEVSFQNLYKENQKLKDDFLMQISTLTKENENLEAINKRSNIENGERLNDLKTVNFLKFLVFNFLFSLVS